MKQLVQEMSRSHTLLVADVQAHKVGTGGQLACQLDDLDVIKTELVPTRKLKERIGPYGELASGVVFTKTLFWQMINATGQFISLRHVDEEGWTSTPHKFSRGQIQFWLWISVTLFGLVSTAVLLPLGVIEKMGWGALLWMPFAGLILTLVYTFIVDVLLSKEDKLISPLAFWLWSNTIGPAVQLRRWRGLNQQQLLEALFPGGHDEPMERVRAVEQIRVRVTLPDCPQDVQQMIHQLEEVGHLIDATPLIIAHRNAVGVSLAGTRVVRSEDPIFCLETKKSVIVFPATVWGENMHEQELVEIIRNKFPHFSVARQN